jgi:response regulator of citrate/malate metabolism
MHSTQKRSAIVLDDDEGVRELILDCLNEYANFDARGYAEAEKVLSDIFDPPQQTPPDLFVVDLYLQPGKMEGIQFLAELVERDVSSEMLLISGTARAEDLERAIRMGVVAVVRKPFDRISQVIKKMEYMADIGKKRRLHRMGQSLKPDLIRFIRPVFLSYAKEDKNLAMGIRRNLEASAIPVWYAPSTLQVGDEWRTQIDAAIRQATCFVSLISDSYVASPFCLEELTQFCHRKLAEPDLPLTIMPVLVGASESSKNHKLIRPIIDNYHYIDMSDRFVDGLTALLGRIQKLFGQQFEMNNIQRGDVTL